MARSSIGGPLAVELEMQKEKASALRRTGERLDGLLAQLWALIVQREAMGLTKHHDVYRLYPIPKKLR